MVETICVLADWNGYSSVECLLHFVGHWSTWSCKKRSNLYLCSSVGFNHTTIQSHVLPFAPLRLLQEDKSTCLILHLSTVMNQMFPGTIWSYLESPERITWSFTTLVKQNTFFALTPTSQAKSHWQTDSFLYDHHIWQCLKYISILNSLHLCFESWLLKFHERGMHGQDTIRNKK